MNNLKPDMPTLWIGLLLGLLALSIPASVALGAANIHPTEVAQVLTASLTGAPLRDISESKVAIIWELRLPRALLACLVGATLAIVGTVMQALVKNLLADPYILGISSGASIGATAVLVFNAFGLSTLLGVHALSVAGFLGALIATLAVYAIARSSGGLSSSRLILGGVAMGYVFSALTSLLIFMGDPRAASGVLFWLLGGLGRAQWDFLQLPLVTLIGAVIYCFLRSNWLNAIAMSDDIAATSGINVGQFRVTLFVICSLLTGISVALCGAIGFVGLIVPHLARLLVGAEHRRVLALSAPLGALLLVWADVVARTVFAPEVLPVGVITSLIGGPLFLFLLIRRESGAAR